ncbi:hypothetical protein NC652_038993 [Populus alba x Populus x berolinensis]|uniref:Uncharacterized protein n=1 Tax=Populus tomentosa TaxID=118781 RepID=A0A8X8C3T3_POPTO|nr:hypothetical protein POTOM_055637 [Populus tomentosa]KAJ6862028.1 hypothetical protein NC652_038993 [Populus alba x Populus x berolinensis]
MESVYRNWDASELMVDGFGEKLLEELDYTLLLIFQNTLLLCITVLLHALRDRQEGILVYVVCRPRIKQILIDAVVHAVNKDCSEMANDFTRLGFLASGTDVDPIIPALEDTWQNSFGN